MYLIVTVGGEGREAIPVRAIPFVASFWPLASPDCLVAWLAHAEPYLRRHHLTAYHLSAEGAPVLLAPKAWDYFVASLKALESGLKAVEDKAEITYEKAYVVWRQKSVERLPAGVFVWRDEFEAAYASAVDPDCLSLIGERPGDRELNFTTWVPEELRECVMEGFSASQPVSEPAAVREREAASPQEHSKESSRDRAIRLRRELAEERKNNPRNPVAVVAGREGVSTQRIYQIINKYS